MFEECPSCHKPWSSIEQELQCCRYCGYQESYNVDMDWSLIDARLKIYEALERKIQDQTAELEGIINRSFELHQRISDGALSKDLTMSEMIDSLNKEVFDLSQSVDGYEKKWTNRDDVLYDIANCILTLIKLNKKIGYDKEKLQRSVQIVEEVKLKRTENKVDNKMTSGDFRMKSAEDSKRMPCGLNIDELKSDFQDAPDSTKYAIREKYSFWKEFISFLSYAVFFVSGLYLLIWGVKVIAEMWGPVWAWLSWVLFPVPIVIAPWLVAVREGIWIYVIILFGTWPVYFILQAISDRFEPPTKPLDSSGPHEILLTGDDSRELHYKEVNLKIKQTKQGNQWINSSWTTGSKFFSPT